MIFVFRKRTKIRSVFLPMMGYSLAQGDVATALAKPHTAVITRQFASVYFGNQDPIGKVLHMHDDDENDELVTITGVMENVPENTHIKFDVLFSYKTLIDRHHAMLAEDLKGGTETTCIPISELRLVPVASSWKPSFPHS